MPLVRKRARWLGWAPVALASLLSACELGPAYRQPGLAVPAAFRATAQSAGAAWPAPDWWHAFGSPELNRLINEASANNQNLAAAAARVIQADAQVRVSGAPLLPTVSAVGNGSYTRIGGGSSSSNGSVAGITTGAAGITSAGNSTASNSNALTQGTASTGSTVVTAAPGNKVTETREYSLQGAVSYEVDFWGKNRAALQSAQASALFSRFDQANVALTVLTSVATTYFNALGAADELAVARRNLASAQATLKVFQVRTEVGTATALDIAQQAALVAGEAAQIPNLQSQFEQQVIALATLVGAPPETITVVADTLTKLATPAVSPGLPSELLARRPDVASAEANLVAQNGNIRVARAAFFPDVTLTAEGGVESLALSTLLQPGSLLFSAAGSIAQPLFDNGLRQGNLDLAKGRYAELVADYRQAVLQAFQDADTYVVAVRYAAQQEGLEREAVKVAQQAADIARAQLGAGVVDITTVLNTQTTLFTDENALAQARLVHFQALINLYKALGGGWTQPGPIGTT